MTRILMLASFGLEIVECGGTLAHHSQVGDEVFAAVTLSTPAYRPQITKAAQVLGIPEVTYLDFGGEDRFAQDGPQYAHAVQELAPPLAQPSLTSAVARGARCHSCARLSAPTGR